MKNVKLLGLMAMAIGAALVSAAGPASATELYSGATTSGKGTVVQMSLSGTSSMTTTGGTVLDTCTGGGLKGTTINAGGAGVIVTAGIEKTGMTRRLGQLVPLRAGHKMGGELHLHKPETTTRHKLLMLRARGACGRPPRGVRAFFSPP
jgi:hypothetical protein